MLQFIEIRVHKLQRIVKNTGIFGHMKKYAGLLGAVVVLLVLIFLNKKDVTIVGFRDLSIKPVNAQACQIDLSLDFNNPNLLSATLDKVNLIYSIDKTVIGSVDIPLETGIPGLKTSNIPFSLRLATPVDTLQNRYTNFIPLHITGAIEFHTLGKKGVINVSHNDTLLINQ